MTPGSRVQAVAELIDSLMEGWQQEYTIPADKLLDRYFKTHRYIGSKDKAYIAESFYWILRHMGNLIWHVTQHTKVNGRTLVFAALLLRKEHDANSIMELFEQGKYCPEAPAPKEKKLIADLSDGTLVDEAMPDHAKYNYPKWMGDMLKAALGSELDVAMAALSQQATTDIRVNTLNTDRRTLRKQLVEEGFECEITPISQVGLRLQKRQPIFTSSPFKQGHFEVQDEGSQVIGYLVDAQPGHKVIDFCAGAGGKTLAMAATMENKGRILAWDTSTSRLNQIKQRIKRAGADNIQIHAIESENDGFIKRHKRSADRVLLDVPCSGSGTWRRNPDLKWKLTKDQLNNLTAIQQSIFESASRLVKSGGYLVYATCSLFKEENEEQVERFLNNNPQFALVCAQEMWNKKAVVTGPNASYLSLAPHSDNTDGFFAAIVQYQE